MTVIVPLPGDVFTDATGRKLKVSEIVPGDRAGREVRGTITYPKTPALPTDYACSLVAWESIWYNKSPRTKTEGAVDP
jgi:hypothetical protein